MIKSLILAILLALSTSALGAEGDLWLNLHIGSKHSGDGYYDQTYDWSDEPNNSAAYHEYNERNLGAGIVYETADWVDIRGGAFRNSHHTTTVYGAAGIHTTYTNPVAVGLMGGISTGYEAKTNMILTPIAMPYISLNTKYVRAEIVYMPSMSTTTHHMVGLSIALTY